MVITECVRTCQRRSDLPLRWPNLRRSSQLIMGHQFKLFVQLGRLLCRGRRGNKCHEMFTQF